MKIVGKVLEEEKKEIMLLYERKLALTQLMESYKSNNDFDELLYNKIICDLGKVMIEFESWWSIKSKKYNWESKENGRWTIDFKTNDIYLND